MSVKIKRSVYADMFGPTTGDRVRLDQTFDETVRLARNSL